MIIQTILMEEVEQEIQEVLYGADNGTGGLLCIFCSVSNELGILNSLGGNGGAPVKSTNPSWRANSGGGSGGGSINIFLGGANNMPKFISFNVEGGISKKAGGKYLGGNGGSGNINVGSIISSIYVPLTFK